MKVIGFNGSARKEGNTSILIRKVFDELEDEGIETKLVNLGPQSVNGCLACGKCMENKDGHCIQKKDALNDWLDVMAAADGIILGSPVYFANISGQIKCFMDRAWMVARANGNLFRRKVGAAVVSARRAGCVSTFHALNNYFTIAEMVVVGSSYWNMGFGRVKGEAVQDGEGMQIMSNLGKNMAWLMKSIEASKTSVLPPETSLDVVTNFIR
ncbi:MAG: flavodoxin family protein [Desulfobacteraceae bacterium]|nr:flavodoxin family protein [Desulfobacteraceae bacterium]